jgi:hypothetical protein
MIMGPGFGAYLVLMVFPPPSCLKWKKISPDSENGLGTGFAKAVPPDLSLKGIHER